MMQTQKRVPSLHHRDRNFNLFLSNYQVGSAGVPHKSRSELESLEAGRLVSGLVFQGWSWLCLLAALGGDRSGDLDAMCNAMYSVVALQVLVCPHPPRLCPKPEQKPEIRNLRLRPRNSFVRVVSAEFQDSSCDKCRCCGRWRDDGCFGDSQLTTTQSPVSPRLPSKSQASRNAGLPLGQCRLGNERKCVKFKSCEREKERTRGILCYGPRESRRFCRKRRCRWR